MRADSYEGRHAWEAMMPVKEVAGVEIRMQKETGRFGAIIGNELKLLKDLAGLERLIAARATPVKVVRAGHGLPGSLEIRAIVGCERDRFRMGEGDLAKEYSSWLLATPELLENLTPLIEAAAQEQAEHVRAQTAYQGQWLEIVKKAQPVTPDNFKEYQAAARARGE